MTIKSTKNIQVKSHLNYRRSRGFTSDSKLDAFCFILLFDATSAKILYV